MFLWGFVPGLEPLQGEPGRREEEVTIPSGKHPKTMEKLWKIHPFSSWVNPLFRLGHFQ